MTTTPTTTTTTPAAQEYTAGQHARPLDIEAANCWFCHDEIRTDHPPTGWLYDDGIWRAGHAPAGYAVAGTVVLEAHRHLLDQRTMNAEERSSLVDVQARLIAAIADATGCDRVYQWATMDAFSHYHLWLVPWHASDRRRGPRHLVASVGTDAAVADTHAATEAATAIRAALCSSL